MHINLLCPINHTGYGIAATNIAFALDGAGHEISLFPIGPIDASVDKHQTIAKMQANAGQYDPDAPSVRIWHQFDMAEHVGRGIRVGYPFFELDKFNARETHHTGECNRIFVTSEWGKKIVQSVPRSGKSDVRVVPLGVNRLIFHEDVQADRLTPDYTVFINVGKWEVRKGHDFLLRAFNAAFRPTDKVLLLMMCFNPFVGVRNDLWASQYLGSEMGANIKLLPRLTTHKSVATVLAGADCGIFPARAEGWNLELLEMMSMGKHVIATHATAHTEFVDDDNCRLIHVSEKEPAEDGVWFHGQGNWSHLGDAQLDECVEHMRAIHRLKQTGQLGRNEAGIKTASRFTWDNTATKLVEGLQ